MTENKDFIPPAEPWTLFREWYDLAQKHEPNDPNAMSLATATEEGLPSVRIVLLKDIEAGSFTFYTNRQSRKGEQLAERAEAGLCFHWKSLRRQIRAEGLVTLVTDEESDAYFKTRPRGSQIGAWASWQSQPLADRATLEQRVRDAEKEYKGKDVPRPPYWGGYRVIPLTIEFWQDRQYRLHDRIQYRRHSVTEPWMIERLYP
jgi:pyridoxamine 5'-phosphate oxidase